MPTTHADVVKATAQGRVTRQRGEVGKDGEQMLRDDNHLHILVVVLILVISAPTSTASSYDGTCFDPCRSSSALSSGGETQHESFQ